MRGTNGTRRRGQGGQGDDDKGDDKGDERDDDKVRRRRRGGQGDDNNNDEGGGTGMMRGMTATPPPPPPPPTAARMHDDNSRHCHHHHLLPLHWHAHMTTTSPGTDNNGDDAMAIHGTDNDEPDNDNDVPGQPVLPQEQMVTAMASHGKGDDDSNEPRAGQQRQLV